MHLNHISAKQCHSSTDAAAELAWQELMRRNIAVEGRDAGDIAGDNFKYLQVD